jgi:hypothetical protein
MNKLWLAAAGAVLSGGLFADTLGGLSTGTFSAMPNNITIANDQATPPSNNGPFWDNNSAKPSGTASNIGDLLGETGDFPSTNVLGSSTVADDYTGANGVDPTAFNFVRNAASTNVSLLYANSSENWVATTGIGEVPTTIGLYDITTSTPYALYGPGASVGHGTQTSGTAVIGPTETQAFPNIANGDTYEVYATLCYDRSVCETFYSDSVTGTNLGPGNNGAATSAAGWNHFALFELNNGSYVIGFEDTNCPTCSEGLGDFSDLVIEIQSIPEPGTVALMGLGFAGLGFLGRRRLAKR